MVRRIAVIAATLVMLASMGALAAEDKSAEVVLGGKVVIRIDRGVGDLSKMDRARIVAGRLNDYLAQGDYDEFNIVPKKNKGQFVVSAGKVTIVSIDAKSAYKDKNIKPWHLALSWAANIRNVIKDARLNNTAGSLKASYQ